MYLLPKDMKVLRGGISSTGAVRRGSPRANTTHEQFTGDLVYSQSCLVVNWISFAVALHSFDSVSFFNCIT